MRAAVLETPNAPLVVTDVELDDPHPGEVLVRVCHCGVCHSDLSMVDGSFPPPGPTVLGHEAAGIVEAVGDGVTMVGVGDHVVLTPCPPCGRCYWCLRSEWSACENSRSLMTFSHGDGGTRLRRGDEVVYRGLGVAAFAERVVTDQTGAVPVPEDLPLDVLCVLGCAVQTGVGAVLHTAKVPPGATVLVLGLGGVGLSVVQGAVLAAAARIVVSDPVPQRRELARRFGATDLLDPASDDVVAACFDLTGGIGVDVAFEAAGRSALLGPAIDATRFGGTTVLVGVPPVSDALTYASAAIFGATEKKLLGCLLGGANSRRDIPMLVDLWRQGRLDLASMITARRPLDQINEALDDLAAGVGVRTVIDL